VEAPLLVPDWQRSQAERRWVLPRYRHQAIFGEQAQRTVSSLLLALIRSSYQDDLTKTHLPSQSYDLGVSNNTIKV
jgi:hypothetical protein